VFVKSNSGKITKTDSLGHYSISVADNDSIAFIYRNKSTEKFAVNEIKRIGNFDISLHIRLPNKYKTLKEVIVYGKSYREDSIENREEYSKDFGYEKPGIKTASSDYSGAAGMDLDEFIDIFRFRHNRLEHSFQKRLIEEEQDKYVSYRFNKALVKRITKLDGQQLDTFMVKYRPAYYFVATSSLAEFYQYILNASYAFKRELLLQKRKEEQ